MTDRIIAALTQSIEQWCETLEDARGKGHLDADIAHTVASMRTALVVLRTVIENDRGRVDD
jgi:hypothetical protein